MKVVVVGGGVSGIAASYYLRAMGIDTTIIEAGDRLGGRLSFAELGERSISLGGKNIGSRYLEFRDFCNHFGVDDFEHFGINTSRAENGRLVSFDRRKKWQALYRLVASSRPVDLLRFYRLARHVKKFPADGFADSAFFHRLAEQLPNPSLGSVFGARFCREWIRPMVVRMNGAECDEAHVSTFGSNLRVALDSYDQLSSGMETLVDKFAATTRVMLNSSARGLELDGRRVSGVVVEGGGGSVQRISADAVCIAAPAPAAAALVKPYARELAKALEQVRYFPVHVIVAQYRRPIFSPEIRAVIFDESSALSNAGAYGASDLGTIRYTFSGRTARRLLAENIDPEKLLTRAEQTLNQYIPVGISDRVEFVSKTFDPGLCAFAADTSGLNRSLDAASPLDGVFFTGDYRKGASIEACFVAAKECAHRIANYAVAREEAPRARAS
jgi:protoporphyrinogen/coproporphyrinogen III oxidase